MSLPPRTLGLSAALVFHSVFPAFQSTLRAFLFVVASCIPTNGTAISPPHHYRYPLRRPTAAAPWIDLSASTANEFSSEASSLGQQYPLLEVLGGIAG